MVNPVVTVDGRTPDPGNSAVPYSLFEENVETNLPWYRHLIGPRLRPYMQHLFHVYSGIPQAEIIAHVDEIHRKAWQIRPYPCVGSYAFLTSPMLESSLRDFIVTRIQNGDKFLDIGTCLGQELRILASAGAPTENMYALDIISDFWGLSLELFRDGERMKGQFVKADFMSKDGMEVVAELKELQGKMDIIHAGYFFHLFDWKGQIEALTRVVKLSRTGAMLFGAQIGRATAEEVISGRGDAEKKVFHHNVESWIRIWEEVQRKTDTKWEVKCECIGLGEFGLELEDYNWMAANARALKFVVTRL